MKKKATKTLSMLLVATMLFTSGNLKAFAEENTAAAKLETVIDESSETEETADDAVLTDTSHAAKEDEKTEEQSSEEEIEYGNAETQEESESQATESAIEDNSTDEMETDEETTPDETTSEEESCTETEATKEETDEPEETVTEETETEETETEETETEETETEETETEETETEETETEETETEEYLFTGLPEEYTLSKSELTEKSELKSYLDDIEDYEAGKDYIEDRITFLVDTEEEALTIADAFDGKLESYSYGVGVVTLPEERSVVEAVTAAADPKINLPAVWPDYINRPFESEEEIFSDEKAYEDCEFTENTEIDEDAEMVPEGFTYNDPFLKETSSSYQWQHTFVGANYAWGAGYKGNGVKVAVIDSGLLKTHEDLSANTPSNGRDFSAGRTGTATNEDTNGHGTHVAGIIGAVENNGKGGSGIAPDAQIRGYRVFNDNNGENSGTNSDVMRAINAAVSDGNDIINMSLGGVGYSGAFQTIVNNAVNKGVVIFAAAGNESTNGYAYPASYDNVYSVAALQPSGAISSFSNFTSTVDFAFPGVNIYSTYKDGGYKIMSGTSQAAPVAAGVAAILLGASNDISALKGKTGKARVDAVGKVMKSAAIKSSSSGTGAGYTYLPKALSLSYSATVPNAPKFDKAKGSYNSASINVKITAEYGMKIYYSTDGKTPSYKNGIVTNGTECISGSTITLTGAKTVTLKAIAVNSSGKASKVTSVSYTLRPIPTKVEVISVTQAQQVALGKSLSLKANVTPVYSCSTKTAWSVSPAGKGVTVNSSGVVKVASNAEVRSYTITAQAVGIDGKTYNGVKGSFTISVISSLRIKSVTLASKAQTLSIKGNNPTVSLAADIKVLKSDGTDGSSSDVVWSSSNTKVATVSASGVVTALAPGSATITALANDGSGKKATCKITVVSLITSISITGGKTLAKGSSITLSAVTAPATATKKTLLWSVTPEGSGVTVKNGKVTASKTAAETTYTIKAQAQDGSDTAAIYSVRVIAGKITSIQIPKTMTLFTTSGNSQAPTKGKISPVISGTAGYDSSSIKYQSSAPGIVTVDASGNLTAKAPGKATITCQSTDGSNKKATCTVNVNIPMSKLTISPAGGMTKYIAKGKSVTYVANYGSEFGNPTNKKVEWISSNPSIATVKDGKVTGQATGTATITARALDGSGVSATYGIRVIAPANYFYLTMNSQGVIILNTDSYCINDPNLDTSCYKVTMPGKDNVGIAIKYANAFQAAFFKKGKQKIKVTLLDGSNKSATITVNVY